MLELQSLLLRPWTAAPGRGPRAGAARAVVDPATGRPLGLVRVTAASGPWWRRLTRPALEVYETEDEALLFSVHCAWLLPFRWEVRDAEDRRLGTLRSSELLAARRAMRAVHDLVTWSHAEAGTLVRFSPELDGKPLAKMVGLAAVLTADG